MNDSEARIIREAIAAFYETRERCYQANLTIPKHQFFPAIIMFGSAPTFYKFVVTEKLLDCINKGTYPSEETKVLKYLPPVPATQFSQGIHNLEYRRVIFQCLEAFKSLIVSLQTYLFVMPYLLRMFYSHMLRLVLRVRLQK